MILRRWLDAIEPHFLKGGRYEKYYAVYEMFDTIFYTPKTVTKSDAEVLANLQRDMKRMVFGQDKAIDSLSSAIKLARAGLREPEKPIGATCSPVRPGSARPRSPSSSPA